MRAKSRLRMPRMGAATPGTNVPPRSWNARTSKPMTTVASPGPSRSRSQAACPCTDVPRVQGLKRLGPMPTGPRRPPVPKGITR